MSIEPRPLDEAQIRLELDQALGGVSPEDLARMAAGAPPSPASRSDERGRIRGRIIAVRGSDVFVDIGGKSEGFLPLDEFEPDQPPQPGQVLDLIPHGFDKDSGLMRLSLKATRVDGDVASLRVGDVVKARVTGSNIGGLELRVHGARGFMPASQIDVNRHEEFGSFIGHWLECEVTEVDRKGKHIVLSRRKLLEKERAAQRDQLRDQLAEGQVRKGIVRRLADFGAFVDLGGIDGLLHVSDIRYSRVNHPKDALKPGDEIEVKILKIDLEKNRISLGCKQLAPDPWTVAAASIRVGDTVEGRVTRLMDFGAFVELQAGVEGLLPISEISYTQRITHPKQVLSPGDAVRVGVLAVDLEKRKLTLSLKALASDPWSTIQERYAQGTTVSGAVTRLADFGAFVQLEEGVEGLIHISELSNERVRRVADVVNPGQVVQVRILNVDPQNRRISLSMKQPAAVTPPEAVEPAAPGKPRKERKKPLRGGLTW